jgi:hypothetical protein
MNDVHANATPFAERALAGGALAGGASAGGALARALTGRDPFQRNVQGLS